jgi:hypothetical protein
VSSSLQSAVKNMTYCWVVDWVRLLAGKGVVRYHVETGSWDHWTFDIGCGRSSTPLKKANGGFSVQGLRGSYMEMHLGLPLLHVLGVLVSRRVEKLTSISVSQSSLYNILMLCVTLLQSLHCLSLRTCLMIWKEFWTSTVYLGTFKLRL